jgi:hypothetical protein
VFESVTNPLPVSRVCRVISGSAFNSYIHTHVCGDPRCIGFKPDLHIHASLVGSRREDVVSEIAKAGHRRLPTSQSALFSLAALAGIAVLTNNTRGYTAVLIAGCQMSCLGL